MAKTKTTEASPAEAVSAKSAAGYVTLDGNEALTYIQAGGRLISVTKQYPNNLFKPGKRYVFLESLDELKVLVTKEEAA